MPYSPIPELNALWSLQQQEGFEEYAEGFALTEYADPSGLAAGWSKDPAFLSRLIPFAQANGSGSFYALWKVDDRPDLATLPVVVFGDEGGQHVVARNLRELFQLLAGNVEISVDWKEAYFYQDEDDAPDVNDDYVEWLASKFDLTPPADPAQIVAAAQAESGEPFATWSAPFLPDPS